MRALSTHGIGDVRVETVTGPLPNESADAIVRIVAGSRTLIVVPVGFEEELILSLLGLARVI
ncbi:hypothetical protein ITJ38_03375 [Agreia pratensis]|uniref:hypothetical protein n=1 Tax=Agreia pratensis TaxID=150121 RepID=UPI001889CBD4|nr:hypothetical protein [Agreia pratensis]MBF4633439.1 hypothetical protein [Agreia pratensis]